MQTPLEIAFEHVEPGDDIKSLIHEKAAHLEKLHDKIISCHVHIRAPHRRQRSGNLFEVTITLRVPGKELVVRRTQDDVAQHAHLRVAIRDAFAAMAVELTGWKTRTGEVVRTPDGPLQGKVVEIRHDREFGQIMATDNRLIYFHKNSVIDGSFDRLQPQDPVELVVQTGESALGPQASSVRRISTLAYDPTRKPSRR